MDTPLADNSYFVSVVVPLYNAEKYVREALMSIARQSYRNFEAIVIDDGSTDGSASIAAAFCKTDGRFRLITKSNEGVGPTRDLGISQAQGSWIALCDADDTWHEEKLARQIDFLRESEGKFSEPVIALGTCGYHINARGKVVGKYDTGMHTLGEFFKLRDACETIYLLNSSVIFRKDIFERLGGYRQDYAPAEDTELWTRMSALGVILNLAEVLVYYRMHGASASDTNYLRQVVNNRRAAENSRRRAKGEAELSYEAFFELMQRDPGYHEALRTWKTKALYRHGGSTIANGQYLKGAWLLMQSFFLSPGLVMQRLRRQVLQKDLLFKLFHRRSSL